jgi:alkanesulfonate monooxygenase SsuD/methylene tetrahydromethanopterin reductase-like flavin-dependent oxidoreductase (luciferase family)
MCKRLETNSMAFQLGVHSYGNTPLRDNGRLGPTSQAIRDVLEAIRLAEEVGLDFFGVGEHHREIMPISSPSSVICAAAAMTGRIGLGSAVTVLATEDPLRVYQQYATAAAVAGDPGRIEITVGRGSGSDAFLTFGYSIEDRDSLFEAKLDLLLAINAAERVSWEGPHRAPLRDVLVVPRANSPMKIRLGSGGSPESSVRAGQLGIPISYGILTGTTEHWAGIAEIYREAGQRAGHDPAALEISVGSHGFISKDGPAAKENFYRYESSVLRTVGRPVPDRAHFEANYASGGMTMVGEPDEIADRLVAFQRKLGHSRQTLAMDHGGIPHRDVLRSIELLGTEVAPRVRAELG